MPEQVFRIVGRRHQFNVDTELAPLDLREHITKRGIVFQREADRVEHRYLRRTLAPGLGAGQHAPEVDHGPVCRQLLDLAFDAGLRLVLYEHPRPAQHIGVQLGLAGAIAADRVDVHAGFDHLGSQDGRQCLVGGDGRDDVGAAHRLRRRFGARDLQCGVGREVADQLVGGVRVNVVDHDLFDAEPAVESQRLELALRAVANQRHAPRIGPGQCARGHQRGGASAQRGGDRQFRQQHRVTGVDVGEHAEGHHGVQALCRVAGVAVDVLERITLGVRDRHQLDHADCGVVGHAGALVELLPTHEVVVDHIGQLADEAGHAGLLHQARHGGHIDEAGHASLLQMAAEHRPTRIVR